MRKYRLVSKKGEGTFSEVLKAQNVKDGRYHAIKCMKNRFDSIEQVSECVVIRFSSCFIGDLHYRLTTFEKSKHLGG